MLVFLVTELYWYLISKMVRVNGMGPRREFVALDNLFVAGQINEIMGNTEYYH